ncbi:hypothetical protein ACJX0J_027862, partial [Zea mays]
MLQLVMGFVEDPRDREAASLVCRWWHRVDALSRKHVTVPFCYAVSPTRLLARFPRLESLAVKGKPQRPYMVEFMKNLARMDVDMSAEERHLFSVGFKNTIGAKRIICSHEKKVTSDRQTGVMIDAYKKKVEEELRKHSAQAVIHDKKSFAQ